MIGKQISAQELHTLIEQGTPTTSIIVDVRTPEEFERGKISGAINIPVDKILHQADFLRPYKTIYLYCLSGSRSELALLQLSSNGISDELYNLTSGLLAWRKEGYPLE
ncbi:MAG: rhodanese-like domain-containing protein [Candidatus Magasanikbacteria bacterium]|nr:rhodanese-like domain-containing protein [Candidatus Magasanikbacteria bacterium]